MGAQNRSVETLWKEYEKARRADRPSSQLEVLDEIKKEAGERRLVWDWWNAAQKHFDVTVSRNWKLREKAGEQLEKEVEEFGEPVVTLEYYLSRYRFEEAGTLLDRADLKDSSHPEFWRNSPLGSQMNSQLPKYIANDYEYGLWRLALQGILEYKVRLTYALDGRYPAAAWYEYLRISDLPYGDREKPLEEMAERYSGRGVGFWAREELLYLRFNDLAREENPSSEDYLELMELCGKYEGDRKDLSGAEADIAPSVRVRNLVAQLKERELMAEMDGDSVTVCFRNMESARLDIYARGGKKAFYSVDVKNPAGSFYVWDKVDVPLPVMDDGKYTIELVNGKVEYRSDFEKNTISLATRCNSGGYGIYAADWKSGEPLGKADIVLMHKGKTVASAEGFSLGDGFTPLPEDIAGEMNDRKLYDLRVSFRDDAGVLHSSRDLMGISGGDRVQERSFRDGPASNLYLDRSAYNPGDTVFFKGILYREEEGFRVAEGLEVEAELWDASNTKIADMDLTTNEFGSVAGEFVIPEGLRNGMFMLRLRAGGGNVAVKWFRVDEFVLPSFELEFVESDRFYVPGDTVTVSGLLRSYSGHSLSDAAVTYRAVLNAAGRNDEVIAEGAVSPASDGTFRIMIPSDKSVKYQYMDVTVKVVDATGETHEYHQGISVSASVSVDVDVENAAEADAVLADGGGRPLVVAEDSVRAVFSVRDRNGSEVPLPVRYALRNENGGVLESGESVSGEEKSIRLPADGLYTLEVVSSIKDNDGKEIVDSISRKIVYLSEDAAVLEAPLDYLFRPVKDRLNDGEQLSLQFASASGPVWAVVELYGDDRRLLESGTVYLRGERGSEGSVEMISYPYKDHYPDDVRMHVFYFKNGTSRNYSHEFRRVRNSLALPLEFSSFTDVTSPGTGYSLNLSTLPGVEAVVSVYDISTETIGGENRWNTVDPRTAGVPYIGYSAVAGNIGLEYAVGYGRNARLSGGRAAMTMSADMAFAKNEAAEAEDSVLEDAEENVPVRSEFAKTLVFRPFLRSDEEGDISLDFRISDKLSTFVVQVFAHDKGMKNAKIRREMLVTLPVKVDLAPPQYLYAGDRYVLNASVSNISGEPLDGTVYFEVFDRKEYVGASPVKTASARVNVPSHGTASASFGIDVPEGVGALGFKAVFAADNVSDGVFVTVPVYKDVQTITESHSAVLRAGMDRQALVESLRSRFVNGSAYGAEYKEISIADMLRGSVPEKVEPSGDDVLSLTEAYYVRMVAESLGVHVEESMPTGRLLERIMACRNADGGFAWFEGMPSSPIVTAVVLERFAKLGAAMDMKYSVAYLDSACFMAEKALWRGGIDTDKYLYVRSMYASVPFDLIGGGSDYRKRMSEFEKYVKKYLVPGKERGLDGNIAAKARRLATLQNLAASEDGIMLAEAWGVNFRADAKMKRSLEADVVSLLEYAVDHRDGGVCYPNLVLPYRGLMESEAYAHAMLCNLLAAYGGAEYAEAHRVAEGIRLWLMLQKETQHWDSDPAYVDAVNAVMGGSPELMETRVLVLEKSFEKPFEEVAAAGNGFAVSRKFYRDGKEIAEGEGLHVGDRITAVYEIWNGENRSFVRLTAPREAALRPVAQLSGRYGWTARPLGFAPAGYRDVKAGKTCYYFDSFPEEKTRIEEEFFVTQEGVFQTPAVEVESLYAPHYRANGAFATGMEILPMTDVR